MNRVKFWCAGLNAYMTVPKNKLEASIGIGNMINHRGS